MEKVRFDCLIDCLCEQIDSSRIKLLIDNGYDEWELIVGMTTGDLIEIGYSEEQAVLIQQLTKMVESRQLPTSPESSESSRQHSREEPNSNSQQEVAREVRIAQKPQHKFEPNPITLAWLLKGTAIKPTKPHDKFLSTLTMISLEDKKLTQICELEGLHSLVMLHLGHNCITKIQGLEYLPLLKTLKLDNNYIQRLEGLERQANLTRLFLQHNQIDRVEGLTELHSLLELTISDQRITSPMTFEAASLSSIGRTLEVLICNGNKVEDITELQHLKVLTHLEMRNNSLKEVSNIADVLSSLLRIKSIVFLGCPIVKAKKYRDYSVILAKTLCNLQAYSEQLDGKKILPAERQYLVKLYSFKHAKQQRQEDTVATGKPPKKKDNPEMNVNRITESSTGAQRLNSASDFHNNLAYVNSKKTPNTKKPQL